MPTRTTRTRVFFIVAVGERFDDIGSPAPKPSRGPWLKRLVWWLVGTSAAAVLGYELTKLLQ